MTSTRKQLLSFLFLSGLFLVCVLPLVSQPAPAQADTTASNTLLNSQEGITQVGQVYGNQNVDIRVTIGKIISIALGFLAVIFLALTLFAGFKYMTSAGNEEKAREAIRLLTNAVIGLVIILLAWFITRFILLRMTAVINNNVDIWYNH